MVTDLPVDVPVAPRRRRVILWATARALGSMIGLVALYYLVPFQRLRYTSTWVLLPVALAGLTALIAWQVHAIVRSSTPGVRAVEALASSIPLLVLTFASAYFLMSEADPATFVQPLTRTDALYFTVTVFATVGFGDISPVSQTARAVVTIQMVVDLLVLGIGLRVILGAVKMGQDRRRSEI